MRSSKEFIEALRDAEKNNQHKKVLSILSEEIGELLVTDKPALIRVLKESGKIVPENIDDRKLAEIISSGIVSGNKKFIKDLIEAITNEKAEYSNFIGLIIQGVSALVKGIGNAISATEKAKGERDVAKEKVRTQKELANAVKTDLVSGIMKSKSKTEQAKFLIQAEREKVLGEESSKMLIATSVIGFLIFGTLFYVIYKKSQ